VSAGQVSAHEKVEKDTLEMRESAAVSLLGNVRELFENVRQQLTPFDNSQSISRVSRLISESVIPVFALFNMCADLLATFGWGRNKRKSKRCSAAFADTAVSFAALINDMMSCLDW
jgi:hypothetical protein